MYRNVRKSVLRFEYEKFVHTSHAYLASAGSEAHFPANGPYRTPLAMKLLAQTPSLPSRSLLVLTSNSLGTTMSWFSNLTSSSFASLDLSSWEFRRVLTDLIRRLPSSDNFLLTPRLSWLLNFGASENGNSLEFDSSGLDTLLIGLSLCFSVSFASFTSSSWDFSNVLADLILKLPSSDNFLFTPRLVSWLLNFKASAKENSLELDSSGLDTFLIGLSLSFSFSVSLSCNDIPGIWYNDESMICCGVLFLLDWTWSELDWALSDETGIISSASWLEFFGDSWFESTESRSSSSPMVTPDTSNSSPLLPVNWQKNEHQIAFYIY